MREIATEIDIQASAASVWHILTDFSQFLEWNPFIRRAEGEVREGARLTVRIEPPGGRGAASTFGLYGIRPYRWSGGCLDPWLDGQHSYGERTQSGPKRRGVTGGIMKANDPCGAGTIARLQAALRGSWSAETSSLWSAANPARGQCSVTALVVHDLVGGDILKTPMGQAWHFYNRVDGRVCDFTAEQFAVPPTYAHMASSRAEALTDTTEQQYRALWRACCEKLCGDEA